LEFGQCISGGIAHGTPASWMRCANDSVAATNEATTVRTISFGICLTDTPFLLERKYFVLVA
jgi:hypothetical protein